MNKCPICQNVLEHYYPHQEFLKYHCSNKHYHAYWFNNKLSSEQYITSKFVITNYYKTNYATIRKHNSENNVTHPTIKYSEDIDDRIEKMFIFS